MTPQQISQDIERGFELRSTIKAATAELKSIEKRLEQAGLEGEQIPLQEADREGRQFLARSPKIGRIVPVIFESDQVIASFIPGSEVHGILDGLAGDCLPFFYQEIRKFERVAKDGQVFRESARKILGSEAPAFINASLQRDKTGIPKSRTIIGWENSKELAEVAV